MLADRRHTLPILRYLRAFLRSDAEGARWGAFPHQSVLTRQQAQICIRNGVNAAVDGGPGGRWPTQPYDRGHKGGQYLWDLRYRSGDVLRTWHGLAHRGNRHHRRRYRRRLADAYRKDPDGIPLCLTRLDECGACLDILRLAGAPLGPAPEPPVVPAGLLRYEYRTEPPAPEPWPARVVAI